MSRRRKRRLAELATAANGAYPEPPESEITVRESVRLFRATGRSDIEQLNDFDNVDELIAGDEGMIWLDLVNPSPARLDRVLEEFGANPLIREDVDPTFERPKIKEFPEHSFIVFYCLRFREGRTPEYHKVGILVGRNFLLTVRYADIAEIDEILHRWEQNSARMSATGPSLLLYSLLDSIVDNYFVVMDAIGDQLDGIEEEVIESNGPDALKVVYSLRRDLLHLRRITGPSRDVLNVLIRRDSMIVQAESVLYYQDIYDHLQRINETIDVYRDILISAVDVYLGTASFRLNSVMKKMTALATILMTLALITGFYGMNFQVIPGAELQFGFYGIVAASVALAAFMAYYFWRIDWL